MDPSTSILIVAIMGLLTTLISSGLGLYFTARARSAAMREFLYTKQVDLISQILLIFGRIRVFTSMVIDPDSSLSERARVDLGESLMNFSELTDTAAALLPTELYVECKRTERIVLDFLVAIVDGADAKEIPESIAEHASKTALLARAYLGIDELSQESLKLFAKEKDIEKLAKIAPDEIIGTARHKNQT